VSDVHSSPGWLLRRASRVLFLGQHGFESLVARELLAAGLAPQETGGGWVLAASTDDDVGTRLLGDLCFPHFALLLPEEIRGDSVNVLAQRLAQLSFENMRGEEIEGAWPCVFLGAPEQPGLGKRVAAVEKAFHQLFKKRLARIARLATPLLSAGRGYARGLVAYFTGFGRVFVSREVWCAGQRRMAADPLAPSRSYLKIEEAYLVMGREPGAGDSVCDLGASPGGWSYSAAKRGARVVAVDNGPLKGGALGHALIEHRRQDAFRYAPPSNSVFEWMFCDLVEDPHQVVANLVHSWLRHGWCRRFVVVLKFGRTDALRLLREVRAADSPFTLYSRHLRIHHLFHNREEFTVVGEVVS
jgi:23S rRNA (cytidine2498-2'-O)-methyltransferase